MPVSALAALHSGLRLLLASLGLAAAVAAHGAATPSVGSAAPAFSLSDQAGQLHRLADYQGKWVVLYFYPKDGTPGCTTEACEFRDNIFAFRDLGVVVLGVSLDDVGSHAKFAAEQHLPFPLLADADKKVAENYGVLTRLAGLVSYSKRETFVIDPKGRIARHYADVDPKTHSKTLLADLRSLQGSR
jgi:thioredoxin-dependent peroxiredoxin